MALLFMNVAGTNLFHFPVVSDMRHTKSGDAIKGPDNVNWLLLYSLKIVSSSPSIKDDDGVTLFNTGFCTKVYAVSGLVGVRVTPLFKEILTCDIPGVTPWSGKPQLI